MSLTGQQLQPTLATTIKAFEHWRSSGQSRRSTPEHLQQQAAGLIGLHPKSVLCRSFNISHSALKQWQSRWHTDEAASEFITLPTEATEHLSDNDRSDQQSQQHQLEITLPNGVALSTNVSLSQLMSLIQAASAAEASATEHRL